MCNDARKPDRSTHVCMHACCGNRDARRFQETPVLARSGAELRFDIIYYDPTYTETWGAYHVCPLKS